MSNKLLTAVVAAAFVSVSAASWAQVAAGFNTSPKYGEAVVSTNKQVVNHGAGFNSAPKYARAAVSTNKTVKQHGVGFNAMPIYPKVGIH
jgi:hypothetical protein